MSIYELDDNLLRPIPESTFASSGVKERADLQRLLKDKIEVISPDTLVISEEFGAWDESKRRIDLLALDRSANLIVIELKRTEDGGFMDLQAIRYAAMVSTMTFENAVEVYGAYLSKEGKDELDPEAEILSFLDWEEPNEEAFAQDVRIVLASAEFSKELTTTILWLNNRQFDIRCVRLRPYSYGEKILIDVTQVIPLPEAEEYQVRVREKETEVRQAKRQWDERSFFSTMKSLCNAECVDMARRLLTWAKDNADTVEWNRGTKRGCFAPTFQLGHDRKSRYKMFLVWTGGVVAIRTDDLLKRTALHDGILVNEYLKRIGKIEGIDPIFDTDKRTRFNLRSLPEASLNSFVEETEALIVRIKDWHGTRREV